MRRLIRATAALAAFAPMGLGVAAAADPEAEGESQKPPAAQEQAEPPAPEQAQEPPPPPPPEKLEEVPPFEAPNPPDLSVIDPNKPPPGEAPSAAEKEEKARRDAVGRQTEDLEDQSAHGVGQTYFGGGIF